MLHVMPLTTIDEHVGALTSSDIWGVGRHRAAGRAATMVTAVTGPLGELQRWCVGKVLGYREYYR